LIRRLGAGPLESSCGNREIHMTTTSYILDGALLLTSPNRSAVQKILKERGLEVIEMPSREKQFSVFEIHVIVKQPKNHRISGPAVPRNSGDYSAARKETGLKSLPQVPKRHQSFDDSRLLGLRRGGNSFQSCHGATNC
jgi:hypothetical protein